MKKFVLPTALILCLIWAISSTWLYWDLYKKSEQFLNQKTDLSVESSLILETQELREFTKDFLERNFTYTEKNFSQIRHSQALLLAADLRASYLDETNKIVEKLKNRHLDYSAKLIELSFSNEQDFVALVAVHLRNENRKVFFEIKGSLVRTARTLENTAGLLISSFSSRETTPSNTFPFLVSLIANRPLSLRFPCKVLDYKSPAQSELNSQLKVLSNTSEMQLVLTNPLPDDTPLKVQCRDWTYSLVLQMSQEYYLAFKDFNLKEGEKVNRNKKDSYDLLIDKVLGNSNL